MHGLDEDQELPPRSLGFAFFIPDRALPTLNTPRWVRRAIAAVLRRQN
jgi:hypothetical protein